MALQIIQSIAFVNLNQVISYYPYPTGSVKMTVTEWTDFPMHVASGDIDTSSRTDAPGTSYASTISARLKQDIMLPNAVILKVTLCSGAELIVGTPDIPVRIKKNSSLSRNTLNISYNGFHQPLNLIYQ